ncbi:MAG: ABC transporter permease [Actinomycetota bacterium]
METLLILGLSGLFLGSIYAIGAVGLVVGYKASRLLNFGHVAVATVSPYLFMNVFRPRMGLWAGVICTVLAGAALGAGLYWAVVRPLQKNLLMAVVASLASLIVSVELVGVVWGTQLQPIVSFLPQGTLFEVGGFSWGKDLAVLSLVVVALGIAVDLAFRLSPIGLRIDCLAQDAAAAAACGIDERLYGALSWGLGGALAATSGVLVAPFLGLKPTIAVELFVPTAAAALIGGLSSPWLALAGGLAIGVLESLATWISTTAGYSQGVGLIVILAVLALRGRSLGWRESDESRSSEGVLRSTRSLPAPVRMAPLALLLCGLVTVSVALSGYWVYVMTSAAASSLGVASVILLRRLGQVSLGQAAFMGVGAFGAAASWEELKVPYVVALFGGIALAGCIGVACGLPALRIRGLNLTVVTLAVGVFFSDRVFRWYWFSGGEQGGRSLGRPWLFESDLRFMWFSWAVAVGVIILIENLARGLRGRIFRTLQESEVACMAVGLNPRRYKIMGFALSAMVAATGGILFGSLQGRIGQENFGFLASMTMLIGGVIAGSGSLFASFVGGLLITASPEILKILWNPEYSQFVLGTFLLASSRMLPEGIFGLWASTAAAVARRTGELKTKGRAAGLSDPELAGAAFPASVVNVGGVAQERD